MASPVFEIGALVIVKKQNCHLSGEEAGIVLGHDCGYQNENGEMCNDGIMIKLQISNTKGIFAPSLVNAFSASGSPTPRRPKRGTTTTRNAITPSPSLGSSDVLEEEEEEEHKTNQRKRSRSKDNHKKKASKDDSSVNDDNLTSPHFAKKKIASDTSFHFRVQPAVSASAKCKECESIIAKGILRLQPTWSKRWYHVACAKQSFIADARPIQAAREMEGFSNLTAPEQKLLHTLLEQQESASKEDLTAGTTVLSKRAPPVRGLFEDSSSSDELLSTFKVAKPVAKKSTSYKPQPIVIDDASHDDRMIMASDTDSDDLEDRPYRVEYATTGRATCKGCDERIQKQVVRISERPLFRGKPGFVIYRHLNCTIFTEQIRCMQNVGGWRRLKKQDREALKDRIEESKILVEKENQELEPDELVQASFQGEMRKVPPGLSANLLPFQKEGCSWMYHQEKNVPEIRGGILADEMGMVRCFIFVILSSHDLGSKHSSSLFLFLGKDN